METKAKENGVAVNGDKPAVAVKGASFINGNPVNKEAVKPEEAKAGEVKKEVPQAEPKPENGQAKAEPAKAAEQPKAETRPAKPALNLEGTLKLVEELHRRKIQRDKLLETINTLEAFEVAQVEDGDETDNNHFQGCVLTIEDDRRRKFTTRNPILIWEVGQYVNGLCVDKLAEIEAGITLPA